MTTKRQIITMRNQLMHTFFVLHTRAQSTQQKDEE